ncbi:hypothetical protein [Bacillus sp. T33-2]|uniref:hypothetical protein n=1 Tax=Bacillus sp. T33-2 TaxID=2054168 RepID=UPI000C75C97E|nr:hypothetical protein [Bacillus sp. T33-2]PLR95080.1 hypothetical protein CVD19_15605 [Bacillus sp. T33-2]
MRNYRYLLKDQFDANIIADDLRLQLAIYRFENTSVTSIPNRNEVIVQIPDANGTAEEAVESFMANYHTTKMLE